MPRPAPRVAPATTATFPFRGAPPSCCSVVVMDPSSRVFLTSRVREERAGSGHLLLGAPEDGEQQGGASEADRGGDGEAAVARHPLEPEGVVERRLPRTERTQGQTAHDQ